MDDVKELRRLSERLLQERLSGRTNAELIEIIIKLLHLLQTYEMGRTR